jgi:hypothetical protein
MSAVDVEISDGPESQESPPPAEEPREERKRRASGVEVEVEREITKRKMIEAITTVVVMVLYMVFTLVRDRDAGVVVIDPDERDDWDE